jgi:exonuclease III
MEDQLGYLCGRNEDTGAYAVDGLETRVAANANAYATTMSMNLGEVNALIRQLNPQQYRYLMIFVSAIYFRQDPMHHVIVGGSGTGKSFLIKVLCLVANRLYNSLEAYNPSGSSNEACAPHVLRVLLCAHTGKAAYNINGKTCHGAFHLRTCDKSTYASVREHKSVNPDYKREFGRIELVIIDELSFVGARLFSEIEDMLRKCKDNTKPFGGARIILVGDFRQLQPVGDGWIYQALVDKRTQLAREQVDPNQRSELWNSFKLYELTTIMRQRDDQEFARMLNLIGDFGMLALNDEQVAMLNTRIFTNRSQVPHGTVFLVKTNAARKAMNLERIAMYPGETFENVAEDVCEGRLSMGKQAWNTMRLLKYLRENDEAESEEVGVYTKRSGGLGDGLPHKIKFKIGCRYIIVANEDVSQGLVNGAVGILRHMVKQKRRVVVYPERHEPLPACSKYPTEEREFVVRVWMEFSNESCGAERRRNADGLRRTDGITNMRLVPLERLKSHIRTAYKGGYDVYRTQFNLTEAECSTVHKAQGDTYTNGVALDLSEKLNRSAMYVALSRSTTLNGLYFYNAFGGDSVMRPEWRKMSATERTEAIRQICEDHLPNRELARMRRECPVECVWPFLQDGFVRDVTTRVNIMFQNIAGFKNKSDYLIDEPGFQQADLVFFCETKTNPLDQAQKDQLHWAWPDYELVYMSGSSELNANNGQMCYVRRGRRSRIRLIAHNCDSAYNYVYNAGMFSHHKRCSELSLFKYTMIEGDDSSCVYILNVYRHPKMELKEFYRELLQFMTKFLTNRTSTHQKDTKFECDKRLILVGDLNLDFRKLMNRDSPIHKALNRIYKDLGMSFCFDTNRFPWTTNRETLIDWCLYNSNIRPDQISSQVYTTLQSDHMPIWCSYSI